MMNPYPDAAWVGLTILFQVTFATVLALVAIRVAGSRRAAVRHAVAVCALAAVLLSPILTLLMRHYEVSVFSFAMKPARVMPFSDVRLSPLNGISARVVAEIDSVDGSGVPVLPGQRLHVDNPMGQQSNNPVGAYSIGQVLFSIWLAGGVFMFLRLVYGLGFQYACLRKGRVVEMDRYPIVLERVQSVLNGERVPQVVASGLVDHPLAVGLFRQRIILPSSLLEEFDEDRLSDVLIHESSHVVHGDLLIGFLQRIAAIIFWPHPLLHLLNRKLARAREEVCDNHVLMVSQPHRYAQTLLDMTAVDAGDCRIPGTVGLLGFNWTLEDRIQGLLDQRRSRMTQTKKWKMGVVFSVFFTGTLMLSLVTVQGASTTDGGQEAEMKEQVNAVLLDLAHRKEAEMQMLSKKLEIDIPPEFQALVDAVKSKASMADLLAIQEQLNREVGQYLESESNRLHSPLWSGPVLDLLGAASEMRGWSAPMLSLYAHGILDSLPAGSLYFGGTDPGRFIITAFNSTTNENSISIITQNALADGSYMNYLRLVYGDTLELPTPQDMVAVFAELVEEDQGRTDGIKVEGGQVQIEGVHHVMKLNAKLSKIIFDRNKATREFYVEESYVIPWMYSYLEPHGFIMKLNRHPIKLSDEMVDRDTRFWEGLCETLRESGSFSTDVMAQKSMAKLRTGIAGLYAYHQRYTEAEAAYKQAIELSPNHFEYIARLADMYFKQGQPEKAKDLLARFVVQNPEQKKAAAMLRRLQDRVGKGSEVPSED